MRARPPWSRLAARISAWLAPLLLVASACGQTAHGPGTSCSSPAGAPSRAEADQGRIAHYLYALPGGRIDVFDEAHGNRFVGCVPLPQATNVGGIAVSLPLESAFVTAGETTGHGQLIRFDLATNSVVWQRPIPVADDICVTNEGSRLYLSQGGSDSPSGNWLVADARTGRTITEIAAGAAAHDTICHLDHSARVYMGGQTDDHLYAADTTTNQVVMKTAALGGGIRPYVVNASQTLAFVTTNGLDGFDVVDLRSGARLFTVRPPDAIDPSPDDTASHGIALSSDEKELWLINKPRDAVDVFDVRGLPTAKPRQVAEVGLRGSLENNLFAAHGMRFLGESNEAAKEGWLNFSADGRYVYVGDVGDVIDRSARRTVTTLPDLANTRVYVSIDFEGGRPIATTTRYATGAAHPDLLAEGNR